MGDKKSTPEQTPGGRNVAYLGGKGRYISFTARKKGGGCNASRDTALPPWAFRPLG